MNASLKCLYCVSVVAMLLLISSQAMADFATPFVETTPVGGTSKEYGYLVSTGPQPIVDFKARGAYVAKHGKLIEKGDRFIIDSAEVVQNTDGYGNCGTKLILGSAAPKAGLAFYCYEFNRERKSFWAIDTEEFKAAVDGYFTMEGEE